MYDPLRHAFFAGDEVVDEVVSRLNPASTLCIICMNPAPAHDAASAFYEENRQSFGREQVQAPAVPLAQYLS
jgi:hypothetical protein